MKSTILKTIILILIITIGVPAVIQANEYKGKRLLVEILIFSGRENPTYYITDAEQIEEIVKKYGKKTVTRSFDQETVTPSILGYRGIVIYNIDGIAGLPETIIIYNNKMEILKPTRSGRQEKSFAVEQTDSMETMLIDKALEQNALDSELRDIIKKESKK